MVQSKALTGAGSTEEDTITGKLTVITSTIANIPGGLGFTFKQKAIVEIKTCRQGTIATTTVELFVCNIRFDGSNRLSRGSAFAISKQK